MTIQQCKYVMKIAKTGSFSEAAKQLFIAQSSLSISIKQLEQELGIKIFERSGNGVYLTNEGEEFARFIANTLVCTGDNKPCSVCPDCIKAQGKGHPDIFETDGIKGKSKNFTVDAIREIRDDAFVIPNESDKKIYILKNGHNMNEQAQNAILKILEEPPSYVYFIIVTESKSPMLVTVLSRVQVYSLLSDEGEITEKEKNAVKGFVTALLNVNESALMEHTAIFQKNNQFARSVITLLSEVFRDALVKKKRI